MRRRFPQSFYNMTTIISSMLALVFFILSLSMIILDVLSGFTHSYMGLITYIALPAMMLFWLFVALMGILVTRRKIRKHQDGRLPVIDLNNNRHRFAVTSVGVGGLVLMAVSGFGSYHAYEYTESVQFCGTTCHNIMKPEYTTYQHSPHAKVPCASCHIGSGAGWYVKSKLSGVYQVYSAIFNKYPRPIATPIHNLRPAKETCEECHWPQQFYSEKLRTHTHYLADDDNTPYQISMLVKVGATEQGKMEGIHAHMYLMNQVSYISTDSERQVIPYVEMRDANGKVTIFRDKENPVSDDQLKKGEHRIVDCIDCHNRPSHIFPHPDQPLNQAMSEGKIDPSIPEIKKVAVEALEKRYETTPQALQELAPFITDYYKKNHPEVVKNESAKLNAAIEEIKSIYTLCYFPEMKADWRVHPDNLDHIHYSGCFRCHDDNHVSSDGQVISKNCTTCHFIVSQGKPGQKQKESLSGEEFEHPEDIGDDWKTTPCKECHGVGATDSN